MQRARLLILICAAAAMGQAALGEAQAARRAAGHAVPAGRNAPTDSEIERAIRARFAASKIATNKFQVRVQGGVATLEGHTDVLQHKGTATRLAKAAGAVKVTNRIEVSQAARARASANLAKGRRRAQLKRSEARSER